MQITWKSSGDPRGELQALELTVLPERQRACRAPGHHALLAHASHGTVLRGGGGAAVAPAAPSSGIAPWQSWLRTREDPALAPSAPEGVGRFARSCSAATRHRGEGAVQKATFDSESILVEHSMRKTNYCGINEQIHHQREEEERIGLRIRVRDCDSNHITALQMSRGMSTV